MIKGNSGNTEQSCYRFKIKIIFQICVCPEQNINVNIFTFYTHVIDFCILFRLSTLFQIYFTLSLTCKLYKHFINYPWWVGGAGTPLYPLEMALCAPPPLKCTQQSSMTNILTLLILFYQLTLFSCYDNFFKILPWTFIFFIIYNL